MSPSNPYIISLCKQLEEKINFKINSTASAKKFSKLLDEKKLIISSHTISRLFGLIKPYRTPYEETLNILSRYLDFFDWEDFCHNQLHSPFDTNYFLTESADGFSLSVLELILANEDYDSLKLLFEKSKGLTDNDLVYAAGELIGNHVKSRKHNEKLFEILSKTNEGKLFFFECFVDEDNNENYFSDALLKFYIGQTKNEYRKLFAYSFVISQMAHKEQKASDIIPKFQKLAAKLDEEKCHFHEISRWLECQIIIDGFSGVLNDTFSDNIDRILKIAKKYKHSESCWIISRSLESLLLFDFKKDLLKHKEFNLFIDKLIIEQKKVSQSIALYSLQLYWIYKAKLNKSKVIYNPFRLPTLMFRNESNKKIAIELATASFFATGLNHKIINSNLCKFCNKYGVLWILKLVEN